MLTLAFTALAGPVLAEETPGPGPAEEISRPADRASPAGETAASESASDSVKPDEVGEDSKPAVNSQHLDHLFDFTEYLEVSQAPVQAHGIL